MPAINLEHDDKCELRVVGASVRSDMEAIIIHTNRRPTLEEADRARTILAAERPEVSREAVDKWIREKSPVGSLAFRILAALSHFAPPREARVIDGMSVEEIATELRLYCSEGPGYRTHIPISRAAERIHRLAQPVPVVDPDAEAKRVFTTYVNAVGTFRKCHWDGLDEENRNGWRAVAAAKGDGA
jgi:hypothetical protein